MFFRQIASWPDAYHVFEDDERIGIVNQRKIRVNGRLDRTMWFAHNRHFFDVPGVYATRTAAALAIPRETIHQSVEAFSPKRPQGSFDRSP